MTSHNLKLDSVARPPGPGAGSHGASLTLSLGSMTGFARAAPAGRSALGPTPKMWSSCSSGASEPESESPPAARARILGLLPILPACRHVGLVSHLEFLCRRKLETLEKGLPHPGHASFKFEFSRRPARGPPGPDSDSDTEPEPEQDESGELGRESSLPLVLPARELLSRRGMGAAIQVHSCLLPV